MKRTIAIERAQLSDRDAAFAIVDEYMRTIDIVVRDSSEEFGKFFAPDSGVWLARDGAEVVGCIALRPVHVSGVALACEVKRLYVRVSHRGECIADRLLDALEAYALARGFQAIYLDTKDDLRAAIRFYARRGYLECERYNDNPQATRFMRRSLA